MKFFALIRKTVFFLFITVSLSYGGEGDMKTFDRYEGRIKEANIAFDYPSGWFLSESSGAYEKYREVGFYERRASEKKVSACIKVTIVSEEKAEFNPRTVAGMAEDIKSMRLLLPEARFLSAHQEELCGEMAAVLGFEYELPARLYQLNSPSVLMREEIVIFEKNARFYVLSYSNTAGDFKRLATDFQHAKESLEIK